MMKKLLLILVALSFNANVGAVTINETTNPILDAEFLDVGTSHWDTNTGLEWLNFSELVGGHITMGYTIDNAVAQYGQYGWRLPTYTEVYQLFDTFFEPDFVDSGNGKMIVPEGTGDSNLIQSRNSWLFDFGTNATPVSGSTIPGDAILSTLGMYLDENLNVQVMGTKFDVANLSTTIYGPGFDVSGWTRDGTAYTDFGVFMVQQHAVPIPPAIWLFGSGLIGLVGISRRKA